MIPTIAGAIEAMRYGALTAEQLVRESLSAIDSWNPKLNAFITVMRESALAVARCLDAERQSGSALRPLHGIPFAIKDNIDTEGTRTTAGSAVYDEHVPQSDAEVVRRLRDAGAVIVGKTNMQEFGLGSTSTVSYFGPVRNPWNLQLHPGGSSGGSAAAVAAGMCCAALGTDTGGSIRTPASYCGVVGLKPTYGLVSLRGIAPAKLSLDHCGPITRTTEDARIVLGAIAGYDKFDVASVEAPVAGAPTDLRQLRIGIPRAPFFDNLDPEVGRLVEDAIAVLEGLTSGAREVALPATSHISLAGETYAFHQPMFDRAPGRYMLHSRTAIQADATARTSDYIRSRWELELLRRTIDDAFDTFDIVVLPTRRRLPITVTDAFALEEADAPRNPELENTGPFNIYGIPAISVPCGFTSNGLPVGLTIAGPRFSEERVLAVAQAYATASGWMRYSPPSSF